MVLAAHMGVMEIISDQQAWNDLPLNTYAAVVRKTTERIETLFVSRCAEDRGTTCGDHMIAGGKHWTDLFAGAETATVFFRGRAPAPQMTASPDCFARKGAGYLSAHDVDLHIQESLQTRSVIRDEAALWLADVLTRSGTYPALTALHSTGSSEAVDALWELSDMQTRDGASDRISALRSWITNRR